MQTASPFTITGSQARRVAESWSRWLFLLANTEEGSVFCLESLEKQKGPAVITMEVWYEKFGAAWQRSRCAFCVSCPPQHLVMKVLTAWSILRVQWLQRYLSRLILMHILHHWTCQYCIRFLNSLWWHKYSLINNERKTFKLWTL